MCFDPKFTVFLNSNQFFRNFHYLEDRQLVNRKFIIVLTIAFELINEGSKKITDSLGCIMYFSLQSIKSITVFQN